MELETFTKEFVVEHTKCDLCGRMTLGALLREAQQVGTDHCDALGVTTERLLGFGAAFVLVKVSVETYRDIGAREVLRLVSEPGAPAHAFYNRYTSFLGQDGKLAAAVDSRWVLADTTTRRVLRHAPEGLDLLFFLQLDKEQDVSVIRAEELTPAGSARACYSRVDQNGHLNNTYYGDILCDAVPVALWQGERGFRKAVLHYRAELPLGQEMQLQCAEIEKEGAAGWYVSGLHEDKRCFEGNLWF